MMSQHQEGEAGKSNAEVHMCALGQRHPTTDYSLEQEHESVYRLSVQAGTEMALTLLGTAAGVDAAQKTCPNGATTLI